MPTSSEESEAIIDIGWIRPHNFTVKKYNDRLQQTINIEWREINKYTPPFIYDLHRNESFNKVYYRIMINGETFLAEKSNISYPSYTGGQTCVKIKAIYDIGDETPFYIQSDWTEEICVDNPTDPYCKKKCNNSTTTKTQNNISTKKRYALAVKSARGASNFFC